MRKIHFGRRETVEEKVKRALEDSPARMAQAPGAAAQAHPDIIPPEQLAVASAEWSKPDYLPITDEPVVNDAFRDQVGRLQPAPTTGGMQSGTRELGELGELGN